MGPLRGQPSAASLRPGMHDLRRGVRPARRPPRSLRGLREDVPRVYTGVQRAARCRSSRGAAEARRGLSRGRDPAAWPRLGGAQYARQEMAPHALGPRRTDSLRTYVRPTRTIGGLSLLILFGAIAWDLADDGFWSHHTLFAGLFASLIVVAVTAAVLNEVLERRQRQRWSVLAQSALFEFVRTARLLR